VLGVGLPADVDQRETAPKPRAVWGQLLAPRERRSRAHGHDADTAASAVLVDWADNVTTFTGERQASTDAGLGDRRGEIRAAAPLGCSHEAGRKRGARRWQTTPARDPPHWGVCVAFVLSQRASRRRSCEIPSRLGRDPAALEQLRRARCRQFLQRARGEPKRGGLLPLRRAWTPSSHRGDAEPALAATAIACGASRFPSTALQYPVGIPNCSFLLIGPLGTQISAPVKVSPSELSATERDPTSAGWG
jgi:hypothetical protein